jgi:hypothetical protein
MQAMIKDVEELETKDESEKANRYDFHHFFTILLVL